VADEAKPPGCYLYQISDWLPMAAGNMYLSQEASYWSQEPGGPAHRPLDTSGIRTGLSGRQNGQGSPDGARAAFQLNRMGWPADAALAKRGIRRTRIYRFVFQPACCATVTSIHS